MSRNLDYKCRSRIPSTDRFYRKPYSTVVLKIHTKKNLRNKKTRVDSWLAFCRTGNTRVENQTKTQVSEDSSICPETSTINAFPEFLLLTDFTKNHTLFWFLKSLQKKSMKQENSSRVYSWIAFCRMEIRGYKTPKITRVWEDSSIGLETSTKNAVQEFHLGFNVTFRLFACGVQKKR